MSLVASFGLGSCDPSPMLPTGRCNTDADCSSTQMCRDSRCVARTTGSDAGDGREDAGTPMGRDAGRFGGNFCPVFPFGPEVCEDDEAVDALRRRDSDEDGLTDYDEHCVHSTNPCNADSDGDGVNDLVETSYGSDPNDGADNPRARGDFVFVVPYSPPGDPPIEPDPTRDALSFATDLQRVDIYVTIDTSGSMGGEMENLRTSFRTVIVPQLAARIPDVWFGAGQFADCPGACTNGMRNMIDMTNDVDAVQAALNTLTSTCGGREPYFQTLWLLSTGDTTEYAGFANVAPVPRRCADPASIGWPCFRPDAVKVIVQAGDEPLVAESNGCNARFPGQSEAAAVAAMNAAGISYIGIDSSTSSTVQTEMRRVAAATGAVDATTGEPIYFRINSNGTGLGENLVTAVEQLTRNVPIRVDAVAENDPTNPGGVNAVDAFILRLETNTSGATVEGRVCTMLPTGDEDGDGFPDHYPRVFPGTPVCFDIIPQPNLTVPATREPQIFRARIRVIGDRFTPLDQREVLFLVPPVGPSLG